MMSPHPIAFVGAVLPEDEGLKTAAFSVAGNRFQVNLLDELQRAGAGEIAVFSVRPEQVFPPGRRVWVGGGTASIPEAGLRLRMIPFINVLLLKQPFMLLSVFLCLVRWTLQQRGTPHTVLLYNLFSPMSLATLAAVRLSGGRAVAIVADMPHDTYRIRGFKGLLERMDFAIQIAIMPRFDGLIPLTSAIVEDYAPDTPHLVLEAGIVRTAEPDGPAHPGPHTAGPVVLYSGRLDDINGIPLLLDAFSRLADPTVELRIYGRGPLQEHVERAAAQDTRIRFGGMIPNEQVQAEQRRATVLVNPRPSTQALTRYTFPSKLVEYMASGRAVISTALPGVPSEYLEHLVVLRDETPEGLARLLEDTLRADPLALAERGRAARRWVMDNKNWTIQAGRVLTFIRRLWLKESDQ